MKSKPNKLC